MIEVVKKYVFYFFAFAIFGWFWEVGVNIVLFHRFVNCGTLIGPWLPIYGWGMIYVILLSKKIKNNYLLAILIFILFGVIEYATSFYLEYVYDTKWWDYSNYLLNINGRICIEGLLIFTVIAMLFLKFVIPFLDKIYNKLSSKAIIILLFVLSLLYVIDYIYCTIKPNKISQVDQVVKI